MNIIKPAFLIFSLLFFICVCGFSQSKMMGFTETGARAQFELEQKFDGQLDAKNLDEWMKFLTSHPHHVGSPQGKKNAEYLAGLFKKWGFEVRMDSYDVLFPTPKTRSLELLGSRPFKARLEEPALAADKTSGQKSEQLPGYNIYSADGDVQAELVYVNRGVPADYEELEKRGINVKGKIVIARYGGSWRGIKPKVAAEKGAIGCIIYSDPADDGYGAGDVYPEGSFRPSDGVQRGSVMDMPVYPGDPLTPGIGAVKGVKRLSLTEASTLMKIPVLPISYADALPLMQSLKGPVAPPSWRGGLPITYHMGPGKDKVHLKLAFNWETRTAIDVIAMMKGTDFPDEWIIRGNHHDGWVNGAHDPISGMVTELEEARIIGVLANEGMRPKRTLVYCAWDAEEPALLGSTEWGEDHQEELRQKAVAYVNTDGYARGFLSAGGSHVLEPFFDEVAEKVMDPQYPVSVKTRWFAKKMMDESIKEDAKWNEDSTVKLHALGAGSDWGVFLQYLGILSVDISFGGEGNGGQYHSIYDSYDYFTRFIDPGFAYGATMTKTVGHMVLRLANADILPLNFPAFHRTVSGYITELKTLLEKNRAKRELENRLILGNYVNISRDPRENWVAPGIRKQIPYLDFSGVDNELMQLKSLSDTLQKLLADAPSLPADKRTVLNNILFHTEASLLYDKGLPRRPWYKHQIYAPGYYTGYGVKTLPGIREAIEQEHWEEASENLKILTNVMNNYRKKLDEAVMVFKP